MVPNLWIFENCSHTKLSVKACLFGESGSLEKPDKQARHIHVKNTVRSFATWAAHKSRCCLAHKSRCYLPKLPTLKIIPNHEALFPCLPFLVGLCRGGARLHLRQVHDGTVHRQHGGQPAIARGSGRQPRCSG